MFDSRRFAIPACLALLSLPWACSGAPVERGEPPRLVLVISLDTLRADALSFYGYERPTAPALARLAAESVVFDHVAAPSGQTLISHKAWFSGKRPLRLIAETTGARLEALEEIPEPDDFLSASLREADSGGLISELATAGYRTAAFVDGGWMRRELGFDRGFGEFDDSGGRLATIVPKAREWLRAHRDERTFLFLHAYDIHCPYTSREPFDSLFCSDHDAHVELEGRCGKPALMSMELTRSDLQAIRDHYDGGIASADAFVEEILDDLREQGSYEEAMIVVTSDHGESLGEHGQIGHGGLYLEQLLVPLVIKFPESWGVPAGRVAQPIELIDLFPTILDACRVGLPEEIDGRSALGTILNGAPGREQLIAQTTFREGRAASSNPTKRALLEPRRYLLVDDVKNARTELYDLSTDPRGLNDLSTFNPPTLHELRVDLRRHDPRPDGTGARRPESLEIDPRLEEELRSLGYIGD